MDNLPNTVQFIKELEETWGKRPLHDLHKGDPGLLAIAVAEKRASRMKVEHPSLERWNALYKAANDLADKIASTNLWLGKHCNIVQNKAWSLEPSELVALKKRIPEVEKLKAISEKELEGIEPLMVAAIHSYISAQYGGQVTLERDGWRVILSVKPISPLPEKTTCWTPEFINLAFMMKRATGHAIDPDDFHADPEAFCFKYWERCPLSEVKSPPTSPPAGKGRRASEESGALFTEGRRIGDYTGLKES